MRVRRRSAPRGWHMAATDGGPHSGRAHWPGARSPGSTTWPATPAFPTRPSTPSSSATKTPSAARARTARSTWSRARSPPTAPGVSTAANPTGSCARHASTARTGGPAFPTEVRRVTEPLAKRGARSRRRAARPYEHLPFDRFAVESCVTEMIGEEELPPFEDGYQTWRDAFDEGSHAFNYSSHPMPIIEESSCSM